MKAMTEEERMTKRHEQILYLRHRLQKGFLNLAPLGTHHGGPQAKGRDCQEPGQTRSHLQFLEKRPEYRTIIDMQANGHQEMFASMDPLAETYLAQTGVHPFNAPERVMDYMMSHDPDNREAVDQDVDMDVALDAAGNTAFYTSDVPFSLQRAKIELSRTSWARAQMEVNGAKQYLNQIAEAEAVARRWKKYLTRENAARGKL